MTAKKAEAPAKAAAKKTTTGNPDEAAARATARKAPEPLFDEVSYQLAVDWLLRRNFGGAGMPFAAKNVNRDAFLPDGAKAVLIGRLDLMQ